MREATSDIPCLPPPPPPSPPLLLDAGPIRLLLDAPPPPPPPLPVHMVAQVFAEPKVISSKQPSSLCVRRRQSAHHPTSLDESFSVIGSLVNATATISARITPSLEPALEATLVLALVLFAYHVLARLRLREATLRLIRVVGLIVLSVFVCTGLEPPNVGRLLRRLLVKGLGILRKCSSLIVSSGIVLKLSPSRTRSRRASSIGHRRYPGRRLQTRPRGPSPSPNRLPFPRRRVRPSLRNHSTSRAHAPCPVLVLPDRPRDGHRLGPPR